MNKPITVSQLNGYISRLFKSDTNLNSLKVVGEITGLKYHQNGHVYFSIVDSDSKVSCFLFGNIANSLPFLLKDGMEVILSGHINLYEKGGSYSLFVKNVELVGDGSLSLAFEAIKEKLSKEGLFSQEHKKSIPQFVSHIGVVTSETGAAIEDILKTIKAKNDKISITIFPSLVQGENASRDIARNIEIANEEYPFLDALIVGRGGGSIEDLWAFNEEIVARAIFASKIPIVSAVGHEVDFAISDMVADFRAATPTAAGELIAYNSFELRDYIESLLDTLYKRLVSKSNTEESKINLTFKLLQREYSNKVETFIHNVEKLKIILDENNPKLIMSKGYTVTLNSDNKLISSIKDVNVDDNVDVRLADGILKCKVISTEERSL